MDSIGVFAIICIWFLNFGISWWNGYAVGKSWVESKHHGGWQRLLAWCGALMSGSGFSWCFIILFAFLAQGVGVFPPGSPYMVWSIKLGYVILVPMILVSGLIIMLDSWAQAYRNRDFASMGGAAWNTFAQIHNMYSAYNDYGPALSSVLEGFSGKSSDDDGDDVIGKIALLLVLAAVASGFLLTFVLIRKYAASEPLPSRLRPA